MPILRTPMIDDDGSGTTGTIINNAWKQEFYNQIDGLVGSWAAVPFAASNFSAQSPMVWTVGAAAVIWNRYTRINGALFWSIYLSWFSGSNVLSGSPSPKLILSVPAGLTVQGFQNQLVAFSQGVAGAPVLAGLQAVANGTTVEIAKSTGANFALTDTPGIVTTMIFEVQ